MDVSYIAGSNNLLLGLILWTNRDKTDSALNKIKIQRCPNMLESWTDKSWSSDRV